MSDEPRTIAAIAEDIDGLSSSIDRVLMERDLAQTKLAIAVIALRSIARLDSDIAEPVAKLARATLLDLGEAW